MKFLRQAVLACSVLLGIFGSSAHGANESLKRDNFGNPVDGGVNSSGEIRQQRVDDDGASAVGGVALSKYVEVTGTGTTTILAGSGSVRYRITNVTVVVVGFTAAVGRTHFTGTASATNTFGLIGFTDKGGLNKPTQVYGQRGGAGEGLSVTISSVTGSGTIYILVEYVVQ